MKSRLKYLLNLFRRSKEKNRIPVEQLKATACRGPAYNYLKQERDKHKK